MQTSSRFTIRKSPRIPGFDYSSVNYYYLTICCHEKKWFFGKPGVLNSFGEIARADLINIPAHYTGVTVDLFNILPNHIHAILVLQDQCASINSIVGNYKAGVSRKIRQLAPNTTVWQRSYFDEIIRNQQQYERIWNYVRYNADKWAEDDYFISAPISDIPTR